MLMEGQEEVVVPPCNDHLGIMKGKRTKRQRQLSPSPLTLAISSSSYSGEEESGGASSSPGEEEEDMANCLILLAQGQTRKAEAPANYGADYKCKTCERSFPSFQALGGHRASHKKPKVMMMMNDEKSKTLSFDVDDHRMQFSMSTALSLQITNRSLSNNTGKSNKVHECSICSAEFSSGQALGGHMRRHRPTTGGSTVGGASGSELQKKSRNLLQLDLNLPAPEEESKFSFGSKEKLLVFSASSLVDCHY